MITVTKNYDLSHDVQTIYNISVKIFKYKKSHPRKRMALT